MQLHKMPLLARVALAIVCGIIFGQFMPIWATRIFITFNGLFGNFLAFIIPLIIIGLVAPAIGELGKGAGKLLLVSALIAYGSTIFSGIFTYFSCQAIYPSIIGLEAIPQTHNESLSVALEPYFTINMPAIVDVMSALILSFCIGIGLSLIKGQTLQNTFNDFRQIIMLIISSVIIPLLPVYIFGMFLSMSVSGQVYSVILLFLKVIVVVVALHIIIPLILFSIAGAIAKKNPLKLLKNMLPAYATALGTSSSAATIPVTLQCTLSNKVRESIASFSVPLCATIHLPGSTMKIVAFSLAFMYFGHLPIEFGVFVQFILILGITMIAAPGVPGGAIMAAVGVIQSVLGFDEELIGLMITVYLAVDSFGTACNVTCDGALAVIIDKIAKKGEKTIYRSNQDEDFSIV